MADFCKECSLEVYGHNFADFAGLTSVKDWEEGKAAVVLCEGCGEVIQVDPEGTRVEIKKEEVA